MKTIKKLFAREAAVIVAMGGDEALRHRFLDKRPESIRATRQRMECFEKCGRATLAKVFAYAIATDMLTFEVIEHAGCFTATELGRISRAYCDITGGALPLRDLPPSNQRVFARSVEEDCAQDSLCLTPRTAVHAAGMASAVTKQGSQAVRSTSSTRDTFRTAFLLGRFSDLTEGEAWANFSGEKAA